MKLSNYKEGDIIDPSSLRNIFPKSSCIFKHSTGFTANQRIYYNNETNRVVNVTTEPDKEGLWLAAKEIRKEGIASYVVPIPEPIYTFLYEAEEASEGTHAPFKLKLETK